LNHQGAPIRPIFNGIDKYGLADLRPAKVVGELPNLQASRAALAEAIAVIAKQVGRAPVGPLKLECPVFVAFMTRAQAKNHSAAKLLLTDCADLSLDYCPSYQEGS
jgi:hypothetical protein